MATAEPLRYAVDITQHDVDALTDFISNRLISHSDPDPVGSEGYRTNAALRGVHPRFTGTLTHWLSEEVTQKAQEDSQLALRRIQDIHSAWGALIDIGSYWADIEGFDTVRWRRVRFHDADAEEKFRRWEEKETASAAETAALVSEYRIPGPREDGKTVGQFVVARDPEHTDRWGLFEGTAQGRHWDGNAWLHARFTGTSPYQFRRTEALALARQHAEGDSSRSLPA
ncbi:hypothetical protein [Streptomyces harbinensis]